MLLAWMRKHSSLSTYRVLLTSWDLFRYSGRRNFAVLLIVVLIGSMLTMFTGLVVNVNANWDKSGIRRAGSTAKVLVDISNQKQLEQLQTLDQVQTVGLLYSVEKSKGFTLCYAEKNCWEKILTPAIGEMIGDYPKEEKEILLSRAYLKEIGREDAVQGDTVTINNVGDFRLSGIFTDYAQKADICNLYISKKYAVKKKKINENHAIAMLSSKLVDYYLAQIITEECDIVPEQISYVSHQPVGKDGTIIILKWILVLLFACGGLSIYHILFAAISADQRTYGLLSVIGMEHDQIFLCMRFQGIFFAIPGILLGELAGACGQSALVPWFMKRFLAADRQVASYLVTEGHFYPLIPLLAALLVVGMLAIGFGMVAWRICQLSPMECLRGIAGQGKEWRKLNKYQKRRKYRIADSKTRLRTLAWQNQKGYLGKNFLTSISFFVSSHFFLIVNSLPSFPGFSTSNHSFVVQKLSCVRVMGDLIGVIVFCVAVTGLYSVAFIHMQEREPEFIILQNIGMTKKQLVRMLMWEGIIQYLEYVANFVLWEIPLWLTLSVCFSIMFPWSYGIVILLLTFFVYLSSSIAWQRKGR